MFFAQNAYVVARVSVFAGKVPSSYWCLVGNGWEWGMG